MTVLRRLRRRHCLLQAAQRHPPAFEDFYRAYAERVVAFMSRRVLSPDVAFELSSEVFAIAFERKAQFRGASAAEEQGWLFAIARNVLNRYYKRAIVERQALERIGIPAVGLDDHDFERVEELAELESQLHALVPALDDLPEDQREALRQRVLEERGYTEIATSLGVSEQVVRARVSRGLKALGVALRPHLDPVTDDVQA